MNWTNGPNLASMQNCGFNIGNDVGGNGRNNYRSDDVSAITGA
jgi:hypothetical protein